MDPEATHAETKDEFLTVYDRYADDIFRFCAMKVSRRELAEDITQEVFMRFWQQMRQGEEIRNERALLYTMARNLVIDWYRRQKEQSLDAMTDQGLEFANEDHRTIEERAQMREAIDAIQTLDEPSRDALLLRFVEGLPPADIAAISGESANVISVRINRALKKVQDILHTHDRQHD